MQSFRCGSGWIMAGFRAKQFRLRGRRCRLLVRLDVCWEENELRDSKLVAAGNPGFACKLSGHQLVDSIKRIQFLIAAANVKDRRLYLQFPAYLNQPEGNRGRE